MLGEPADLNIYNIKYLRHSLGPRVLIKPSLTFLIAIFNFVELVPIEPHYHGVLCPRQLEGSLVNMVNIT